MIKILNIEPFCYNKEARSILKSVAILYEKELSRKQLLRQIKNYDVLITRFKHNIDKEIIFAAKRLKIIATATTGVDHIDMHTAKAQGIEIVSLRGETKFLRHIPSTAEHTWALLLSTVRRLPQAFYSVLHGKWERNKFIGNELCGKNLGIIGLGRIGEKVACYGICFGMKIHAYDPFCKKKIKKICMYEKLNKMLTKSNVLTIHAPPTPATTNLIGKKELSLLPKGSIVLNTSRSNIIDEEALVNALKRGHLKAAGLDVIDATHNIKNNILVTYARHHNNLIITPHIAGATEEAWRKTEVFIAQKIVSKLDDTQGVLRKRCRWIN